MTVCGGKIYKLMRDLLSPALPKDKKYTELIELVKKHTSPEPSVIVERFKFNSCVRESKESVADYEARLRNLTTHCKYSAEILTEMLRDRFVCGINNETIQRRLLAETKLTLKKALTLAKSTETAVENTRDISGANKSSASVNFVKGPNPSRKSHKGVAAGYRKLKHNDVTGATSKLNAGNNTASGGSERKCFRCLRENHTSNECYFKDAKCHVCGKLGHISPACRQKKQNNNGIKTNQLTTSASNDEHLVEDTYNMLTCNENMAIIPAYTTGISINGKDILMEIDTGASLPVISDKVLYKKFGDNFIDDMKDV